MQKLALGLLLVFGFAYSQEATVFTTTVLTASDGLKVYSSFYPALGRAKATVLAFHQAGGNKSEYASIAPHLTKLGFNVLALDQRSGGSTENGNNQTVQNGGGKYYGYLEALPDLEAAVAWAKSDQRTKDTKLIAWGSSYSASLVFLLAKQHPEIAAVMAFSPADSYLETGGLVFDAAKTLRASVFIACTANEVTDAKAIFNLVPHKNKILFVPKGAGFHGSNALNLPSSSKEYWAAVEKFLNWFK
jgi:dienelactone hydrolase